MNTGIILIGLAFVMLSVGLMVSPASAALSDNACSPGCGSTIPVKDISTDPADDGILKGSALPCILKTGPLSAP